MITLKVGKEKMKTALKTNDTVLLSYFHPKSRRPIRTKHNVSSFDPYVKLDGKRYDVEHITGQVYKIV